MSTATFICAVNSKKCAYLDHSYFLHPKMDHYGPNMPESVIIKDWSEVHWKLYHDGLKARELQAFLRHQIGESCNRNEAGWLDSVIDFCKRHKGDLFFAFNDTDADYSGNGVRSIIFKGIEYQQEND